MSLYFTHSWRKKNIQTPLVKKMSKCNGKKLSLKIPALKIKLTAGATILKLMFGHLDNLYELKFHAHIAENKTRTFYFIKEINFTK